MTISQAFDLALQHHHAGRLADAEALYRQILAASQTMPMRCTSLASSPSRRVIMTSPWN